MSGTIDLLEQVTPPEDYLRGRERIFPSMNALQWFIRANRDTLEAVGAILMLRGQRYLHAERFDQAVLSIGSAKRAA